MRSSAQLKLVSRTDPGFDYTEAFSRNLGLVSEAEQSALRSRHVAIPGCGGVGSAHAIALARAGVGRFTLADFDRYEVVNFNRQLSAKCSTLHREKVDVVAEEIRDINPSAEIRVFHHPVDATNVDSFLEGVDLVVDSLDFFAFAARDALFPAAQRKNIPLITAAPLGFSCALLVFLGTSMSYERYFDFRPSDSPKRRAVKFAMGLAPKALQRVYMDPQRLDLEHGKGPSHVAGVLMCASMATTEAMRCLLGRGRSRGVPQFRQFDAYRGKWKTGRLWMGNRGPWQRIKIWAVLKFLLR